MGGLLDLGVALRLLSPWLDLAEEAVLTGLAIFTRISAIVFLLPGFGERMVSVRVKLMAALAFSIIAWPLIAAGATEWTATGARIGYVIGAEAVNGLLLGLMARMLVFALQTAGALAAQSLSISQMFGAGVAPDPEPTIATLLTLGGVTLALTLGLHVKAAALIVESYQPLPLGVFPLSGDAAALTTARMAESFNLAISIALPFVMAAFVYNLALGFINKAMPQLMVALVGLPAITWLGILLLTLTAAGALAHWHGRFDAVIAAPLEF